VAKKLTTEQFIINARRMHGFRFDYNLVDYKNTKAKENGFNLSRIPYTEIKNIDQILTNFLLKESNDTNP
jgi:hypothetical protein